MPHDKKPSAKKFTIHQITLDPETLRVVQAIIGTEPEVNSLSAAIRHVIRFYEKMKPRFGAPQ